MRRAVVAYDDLPHAQEAVAQAAQPQRRKRAKAAPYVGDHWDAPERVPVATPAPPAPWEDKETGHKRAPSPDEVWYAYQDDEAMIASPTHSTSSPFLDDTVSLDDEEATSLTAEEMWDDTFLIEAWDAAEEEYRTFHAHRTEAHNQAAKQTPSVWHSLPSHGFGSTISTLPPPPPPLPTASTTTPGWTRAQEIVASTPNTIGGTTSDERTQTLAMAWYYAGYYTALYEQNS